MRRAGALRAALAAFVVLLFAPALFTGRAFYGRDLYSFWQPAMEAFVRAVAEGAWPSWNPGFGFGAPLAANPNFQIAYPPTWLNLVLPPAVYFKLYVAGHALAGALGTAALARRLRAGRLGADAAGMVWADGGALVSSISMFHHYGGAAWMPWVVLAVERVRRRPTAARAVVLAGTAAGQALTGSADLCFMTALVAAGWVLSAPSGPRTAVRAAPALGGAAILAALLASVQWLPALALVPGTSRGAPVAEASLYWSLHPLSLLDAALPRLTTAPAIGGALGEDARLHMFEGREPLLASTYFGLPAAMAVGCGLLARPRRRAAAALVAGLVLLVLCALGRYTPLLPAVLHVPGVAVFRFPPKYLLGAGLMWSLLAGRGVGALARGGPLLGRLRALVAMTAAAAAALPALALQGAVPRAMARALAQPLAPSAPPPDSLLHPVVTHMMVAGAWCAAGALLLGLAALRRVSARTAAAALACAAAGDLAWNARDVNVLMPAALVAYRPPVVAALLAGGQPVRIYSQPYDPVFLNREFTRFPAGLSPAAGSVLGSIDRLSPEVGTRWGLLGSYDGDLTGLAPPAFGRLSYRLQELWWSPMGAILLQRAGVDVVVSLKPEIFRGLPLLQQRDSVYAHPVLYLRLPDSLPKAFWSPRARLVSGDDEALRRMEALDYDPRLEVVVASLPPDPPSPPAGAPVPASTVRALERRSNALAFEVSAAAPGYLVVLESFDRGWSAQVDGEVAPVLRAHVLFRAVPVPAGTHRVDLRYRAPLAGWGAALTAAGLLAGAAVLVRRRAVR